MRNLSFGPILFAAARPFRSLLAILILAAGLAGLAQPAQAATPAEQYVAENVQKGLIILNDKQLTKDRRRAQFQDFLLDLTDIKTIAEYTLGQYKRTASADDLGAYTDAFKDFALKVYQSYFSKYAGQTLEVTGSYPLDADESVVKTIMIDPAKQAAKPLQVDFRVAKIGGRLAVIDFSVEGVWVRELEKNDFTSFLGQNNGDVGVLTASLKKKTQQMR